MNPTVSKALQTIAVYVLGILCPAVPQFVWTAIVAAIFSGVISPEHILEFAIAHNISVDPDYSIQKNGGKTVTLHATADKRFNFNQGSD